MGTSIDGKSIPDTIRYSETIDIPKWGIPKSLRGSVLSHGLILDDWGNPMA